MTCCLSFVGIDFELRELRLFKNSSSKKLKREKYLTLFKLKKNIFPIYMNQFQKETTSFSDGMFIRIEKSLKNIKQNNPASSPKKIERYSSLHNHSDLSLLDGASRISEMVEFTKELKIGSLSITDHGVMHAVVDLFKECEKSGIKPIAGNEMYVINGNISRNYKRSQLSKYHQIVLALSEIGYKNLVKLTTLSHLNGWQGSGAFGRPCISKRLLFKYKKDIVLTSACLGGEICQNLLDRNFYIASKVAEWYKQNFEEYFFLELQDHGHREDRAVNMSILKMAKKLEIKLLSTNDSHFTRDKDVEAHDTLLCIQTGKPFNEPGRMRYSGIEFLKSQNEMNNMYRDHVLPPVIDSALLSTIEVSSQAINYSIWSEITIPKFEIPEEFIHLSLDDFLEFLGYEGLDRILKEKFLHSYETLDKENLNEIDSFKLKFRKYYDRLKYELTSIKKMGFSTYFLVVWDFIDFARKNNVPIGSGRGSVAGSLVAFTLGITNIDPIEHGLLFERFLNPARKSMPDIDTDFSIDGRDLVIEYVSMKYGQEKVAQIITFNRLTSKAILKDMGRSARKETPLIEKMSELIPISRGKPLNLKAMISNDSPSQDFRQNYLKNEDLKDLIDKALNFEGMNKTTAVHAAGIVISSKKLDEVVPLTRGLKGEVTTQYPMEDVEYLGLLKMDFLGLKNLSMVENIVNFVNYRFKSKILTLDSSFLQPHFDKNTFNLLSRGDLDGVFQLDASPGMKDIVSEMRPGSIQDISSILALYRPGPLDTGLIPRFIKRKRKVLLYKFDYPELKVTLDETYGILIYQEQIMKVAQELGGYSMSQADILRRAMGKKKISEMRTQEKIFIEGCINNSFEKIAGRKVFRQMLGFAEYCFNKSHSTAYAFTTYQTAWLKSHWPVEFYSSLLSINLADFEKIEKFIYQAASLGIFIRKPEINTSDVFFVPDYSISSRSCIHFGLGSVKNIGEIAASIIITERKIRGGFLNLNQLVDRLINKQLLSKKLIETLIISGSLDEINGEKKREKNLKNLDKIIEWMNRTQKIKFLNQPLLLDLGLLKKNRVFDKNSKVFSVTTDVEQTCLAAKMTGILAVNSLLLNHSEIIILLGITSSLPVPSSDVYNTNLINASRKFSEGEKFSPILNKIEKTKIFRNFSNSNEQLFISVILEIQEYKTSSQKKIIKMICEDLVGIYIAMIFEKNDDSFPNNEKQIKQNNSLKSSNKFLPGNLMLSVGVEEKEMIGWRKMNLTRAVSLHGYKIIVIEVLPSILRHHSIHLLLKLSFSINSYASKIEECSLPVLINVKGKFRSEILKTGLSVIESDMAIIFQLLRKLGFECKIYQFNQNGL